ncbi:hypothetical protein C8R44DRAFT_751431 [Mycena epipterygia]|nr:hypothetical protein C8R44DRAFT_751431 [Mycena epipterygia]
MPHAQIHKAPSAFNKPGAFYFFQVPLEDVAKFGCAKRPRRRQREWARQCRGQQQVWKWCWQVPFAAKFGTWVRPAPCKHCGIKHQEKYRYSLCRGRREISRVVEYYLGELGWPVIKMTHGLISFSNYIIEYTFVPGLCKEFKNSTSQGSVSVAPVLVLIGGMIGSHRHHRRDPIWWRSTSIIRASDLTWHTRGQSQYLRYINLQYRSLSSLSRPPDMVNLIGDAIRDILASSQRPR